jgi:predicted RNA polymerase sigma factor
MKQYLVRLLGDIDAAEEAVQDAFTEAVRRWPVTGPPPSPGGWIITTARNRAIDRFRRESSRDDRLRLIFTCCHPALATNVRVALTLRLLGGLSTQEIARAFLVPESTMAQRLVRAKAKIRDAVVALNRAVAVGEVHGPAVALALVDDLDLTGYHVWHAIRADLLRRLGRTDEAADAYLAAAEHTENTAERDFLTGQASTARRASDGVIP